MNAFLSVHTELRPVIGRTSVHAKIDDWEAIVVKVEEIVGKIYEQSNIVELDVVSVGEVQTWGGAYKTIPYWRCQPYFRKVNGEKQNTRVLKVAADRSQKSTVEQDRNEISGKRKADDELQVDDRKRIDTTA